ncbi:hypothetical protein A6122_2060 [Rathayibacter tritici]|uniref:Uncharacterized protein n=2 Tax=Rathayibacter tritici TaxID=33888 RepID=A0A160KUF4_9MICO|nr:hypothetical protein A6122_2060 [Rathayibacter tritici]
MDYRKTRSFRLCVVRGSTSELKPIASIAISADGGIMVAPVAVSEAGWWYGKVRHAESSGHRDFRHTEERPKLHYHRSGWVAASLSGRELERKWMHFPRVDTKGRSQLLSIVVARPWALASSRGPLRKGDLLVIEKRWPQSMAFSFSLITTSPDQQIELHPDLPNMGLVPGDDSQFLIDMSMFRPKTALLGRVKISHEPTYEMPGIAVAAVSWSPAIRPEDTPAYALFSDTMRSPAVFRDVNLPGKREMRVLNESGEILLAPMAEHFRRIGPVLR